MTTFADAEAGWRRSWSHQRAVIVLCWYGFSWILENRFDFGRWSSRGSRELVTNIQGIVVTLTCYSIVCTVGTARLLSAVPLQVHGVQLWSASVQHVALRPSHNSRSELMLFPQCTSTCKTIQESCTAERAVRYAAVSACHCNSLGGATWRYDNGTDGQTDGQTDCDAICGPLIGRRAA